MVSGTVRFTKTRRRRTDVESDSMARKKNYNLGVTRPWTYTRLRIIAQLLLGNAVDAILASG